MSHPHRSSRDAAVQRLRADGSSDAAVAAFLDAFDRLSSGDTGTLPESEIEPLESVPASADLHGDPGAALSQVIVVKLNGGLGTSMGLTGPKSLLPVRDGRTFLDLTADQIVALRDRTGVAIPLVLMDSFATRGPSLAALAAHGDLSGPLPADFLQNRVPKLDAETLAPVDWPPDPSLTWAPPGHGDFYPAMAGSGMLAAARDAGYRWAFVSNVDNLGATLDPAILAHVAAHELPFVMEVADRTAADRKGGHLARRVADGSLVLREIAQTPEADRDAFADISRHRYFNTNSLWIDLDALAALLAERGGALGLPMIVNHKTVDPTDPGSTPVIQLETAMGAAIGVIPGAAAVRVPRSRFAPVKTTSDLLALRSDAYVLDEDRVVLAPGVTQAPAVDLSGSYRLVADFDDRFPAGPPSLIGATSLTVRGDVRFGAGVVVRGAVTVDGAETPVIDDGTVLDGG